MAPLAIPIFDLNGEVLQMYGRKITRRLRPGTPDHLYLPGPHRGVWNEEALALEGNHPVRGAHRRADLLVCGVPPCYHQLRRERLYQRDQSGVPKARHPGKFTSLTTATRPEKTAAQQHAEELMAIGIECFRVQFPKSMDANEYALEIAPRRQEPWA